MEKELDIAGVYIKELVTHTDERGFFREMLRQTDEIFGAGFGQLSHSLVYPGVIKAWHAHRRQVQWTYAACGLLKVVLHDGRRESPTFRRTVEFLSGDHQPALLYSFPPGVIHGYRCLAGPAHVFYITSGVYDLDDEVRIPHNDPEIGYDWTQGILIK